MATAPAPQPGNATPPPPGRTVATAEIVPQSAAPPTTALTFPEDILALGRFERHEEMAPASGPSVPYIQFYTGKGGKVADVIRDVGASPAVGTPIANIGGKFYVITGTTYLVIQEMPYWAVFDQDYNETHVWLNRQPFGKKVGNGPNDKVKECAMGVVLLLPGASPLPEAAQPAVATLTTLKGAQVKGIKAHVDAVEATEKPEWSKVGANGAIAGAFPPRYRIASSFRTTPKTAQGGGFTYVEVTAIPATISLVQLQAFHKFTHDPDCRAQLNDVLEAFDRRAERLQSLAEETVGEGGGE